MSRVKIPDELMEIFENSPPWESQLYSGVSSYWLQHYTNPIGKVKDGVCVLCGDCGLIDTRESAIDKNGNPCGALIFCFCPVGQAYRKSGATVESAVKVLSEKK